MRDDIWTREVDGQTRNITVPVDDTDVPQTVRVTYEVLANMLVDLGFRRA